MTQEKTILVMDDDDAFHDVMKEVLDCLGYSSIFVKNGDEALVLYKKTKESNKPFDAVIMDLHIEEGINAGMWSIGVIKGGSELGLSYDEVLNTEKRILTERIKEKANAFKNAGAHFVLKEISELEQIIKQINKELGRKRPYTPY